MLSARSGSSAGQVTCRSVCSQCRRFESDSQPAMHISASLSSQISSNSIELIYMLLIIAYNYGWTIDIKLYTIIHITIQMHIIPIISSKYEQLHKIFLIGFTKKCIIHCDPVATFGLFYEESCQFLLNQALFI